jgi:lysophospholipase L1-like esterase
LGKELSVKNMDRRKQKTTMSLGIVALIILTTIVMSSMLQPEVDAQTIRVACVGDSITEYSGYTAKLQEKLGSNYVVGNFGVSGSTVSLDGKIAYMKQQAFLKAEHFEPELVVIMLGTNDANCEIANDTDITSDYMQLIDAFKQLNSNPDIIVVNSPPIYSDYSGYNNTFLTTNVIPTIDNVANNLNLTTVDMYSVMNNATYFKDGIHPNDEGAGIIANTIYDAVVNYYS